MQTITAAHENGRCLNCRPGRHQRRHAQKHTGTTTCAWVWRRDRINRAFEKRPATGGSSKMFVTGKEPHSTWGHEVGACVTHKDGPMPSLVERRVRASNGMEIYG